MRYGALASIASFCLLAGCSFIDDWTTLSTRPGAAEDGGMNDAGSGQDSGPSCTDSCDPGTGCPNEGEVCALASDGCLACQACTGCDPLSCPTACEVVTGTAQCVCQPSGEGGPCFDVSHCEIGLGCDATLAACLLPCATDAECTGVYPYCVEGRCYLPSSETDCANGFDDDGDRNTDCADLDCTGDASCIGTVPEWEFCADAAACMVGLSCRNGACVRNCATASECGGDFPECADVDSDGVTECTPALGCDFVANTGCDAAYECRLIAFPPGGDAVAGCVTPRGTVPVGSECSDAAQCAPGAECLSTDGTVFTCYQWCYVDDPATCPAGQTCNPLTGPDGSEATYMGRVFGACL